MNACTLTLHPDGRTNQEHGITASWYCSNDGLTLYCGSGATSAFTKELLSSPGCFEHRDCRAMTIWQASLSDKRSPTGLSILTPASTDQEPGRKLVRISAEERHYLFSLPYIEELAFRTSSKDVLGKDSCNMLLIMQPGDTVSVTAKIPEDKFLFFTKRPAQTFIFNVSFDGADLSVSAVEVTATGSTRPVARAGASDQTERP